MNDQGLNVIRTDFSVSDRDYGVEIFLRDCESATDVPSLDFSDKASSTPGFVDVRVDAIVNPADLEASVGVWENNDDRSSFQFCLSTYLRSNGGDVVVRRNDVFRVGVNDLVGGFFVDTVEITPRPEADTHDDEITLTNGGAKIDAYECDPATMDRIVAPEAHEVTDIVHVCLSATETGALFVDEVVDLTAKGFVAFDYVVDGVVPNGKEDLSTSACTNGVCLASVQLVEALFLSDDVETLSITGTVRLTVGGGRVGGVGEAQGSYDVSIELEKPCRDERRNKLTEYVAKMLESGF